MPSFEQSCAAVTGLLLLQPGFVVAAPAAMLAAYTLQQQGQAAQTACTSRLRFLHRFWGGGPKADYNKIVVCEAPEDITRTNPTIPVSGKWVALLESVRLALLMPKTQFAHHLC